jgi:hypothetical protein
MSNFARILKSTFGSQKKIWAQFAAEIEAKYENNGLFKAHVITKELPWGTFKIDTFIKRYGRSQETFTRFQLKCSNPDKLEFLIVRKRFLGSYNHKGLTKITTDYVDFDKKFRMYVSDHRKIKRLLNRNILSNIIMQKPFNTIDIELRANHLELRIASLNKDIEQLKSLFDLMLVIRNQFDTEFNVLV